MSDLVRAVFVGAMIVALGGPPLWCAVERLRELDTLPRPRWSQPKPARYGVYDWEQEETS